MSKTSNMLGALSIVLADAVRDGVNENLGMSGETASAIITLGANPGLVIGQLAEALALSHSGTVRLVDRLEKEGLVGRQAGKDSRTIALHLTQNGQARRWAALHQRERVLEGALAHLSKKDARHLERCLDTMLRGLLTKAEHGYQYCRMCEEDVCVPEHCPVEERWQELFG